MKTNKLISIAFLFFFASGLFAQAPASYGIYLSSNNVQVKLVPHKTFVKGNLVESISGLNKATGKAYPSVEFFYSYLTDKPISDIKLSKLTFSKGEYIRSPFGQNEYTELNGYINSKVIPCTVSPVQGKQDLFKITPSEPLTNGFYAIHWGCLTEKFTSSKLNAEVYDFVVGNSTTPYMSADEKKAIEEEALTSVSVKLLEKANKCFNEKDYVTLRSFYHLNEDYTDEEWKEVTEGFENWYTLAGKILSYKIILKELGEDYFEFQIDTKYEKIGEVREFLVIEKLNDKYFIDSLGKD